MGKGIIWTVVVLLAAYTVGQKFPQLLGGYPAKLLG